MHVLNIFAPNLSIGILVLLPILTNSAEILMIFNAISRSHYILGEALGTALADNGHKVTMVSPFKRADNYTNYNEIVLDGLVEKSLHSMYNYATNDKSAIGMIKHIFDLRNSLAEMTMQHKEIKKLVNGSQNFDLFITEFNLNECIFGFGQYYKTINVVFSTIGTNDWTDKMVGFRRNPASDPNIILGYTHPMSYYERFVNTIFYIGYNYLDWSRMKFQENVYNDFFRPVHKDHIGEFPTLDDLYKNFSLILLNNNFAVTRPTPQYPNMINVGGMHIKSKKLPKDLQSMLDKATEGMILFSMGGNFKSSNIPKQYLKVILKSLGKLKHKVLWKWEDEHLPNKPENIIIRKWIPQQDVLAHNNTVAFITHGGMLSKLEAIYFGVPMLGIPVIGDQFINVAEAVRDGIAVLVELNKITENSFENALNNILNNPSYRKRIKELSAIFRDSSETPLQIAVNSIEYILRHKGAPYLMPPVNTLPIYQALLIDVIAGLVLITIASTLLITYTIKFLTIRILLYTNSETNKVKKT